MTPGLSIGRVRAGVFAVLAALWLTVPLLPGQVAVHFDLRGHPDRWTTPVRAAAEFSVAIIAMVGMFVATARLLPRVPPRWVNLPHRDEWLAPPHRAATLGTLADWLRSMALAISALFGWLWAMLLWAHHRSPLRLPTCVVLTGAGIWLAALAGGVIRLYVRFSRPPPTAVPHPTRCGAER